MSLLINALIFVITLVASLRFFKRDGTWALGHARAAFRFFTVQSNVFCALAALLMCVAGSQRWAWLLKYIGTAAVTVTMMTVLLFLGPSLGGYKDLLKGFNLFMHLLTPLMAIFSFCFLEKRGLAFSTSLLGMLPVVLYGSWYLYKTIYAPEGKRWEDFYGYNKGGKWPLSLACMLIGTFLICMLLRLMQNL